MASSNQLDPATIVLLVLGVIIVLPLLTMGMGGGMMGGYGMYGGSSWLPLAGMLFQLVFLLLVLGGGYLVVRRVSEAQTSQDSALEELRLAYARGDLSDEEFEQRRMTLARDDDA